MTTTASAPQPLRRNAEYRRWLLGDVCLELGTGIGTFAFPLVTYAVTGSLGATGLVGMIQGSGASWGWCPEASSPTGSAGADCGCSPARPERSCRPC